MLSSLLKMVFSLHVNQSNIHTYLRRKTWRKIMSTSPEFYVNLNLPVTSINENVGYHFNKNKNTFEFLAPDDNINFLNNDQLINSIKNNPSFFSFGHGVDFIKHSFPLGPCYKYANDNSAHVTNFFKPLSENSTLQLYAVFLDKTGKSVHPFQFDARKQKYIVYGGMFFDECGKPINNFTDFLNLCGLGSWIPISDDTTISVISSSATYTKTSFAASNIMSVKSMLMYTNDKVTPCMGPNMCMSEDGISFFSVIPHIVPSPTYEMYPLIYATVNENGFTSSNGPCDMYILHMQNPTELCLVCENDDIVIDTTSIGDAHAHLMNNLLCYETIDMRTGNGVLSKKAINPHMLIKNQKIHVDDIVKHVNIQAMNIALIDAPLPQRIMQLFSFIKCGIDVNRLGQMDPEDKETMDVHTVHEWLEKQSIISTPSIDYLANIISNNINDTFNSSSIFHTVMAAIDKQNPKKLDKSGMFKGLIESLNQELLLLNIQIKIKIEFHTDDKFEYQNGSIIEIPTLLKFYE